MRLGYAVQLGTVRFLGTFLDDPADVPPGVSGDIARQLGIADPRCLTQYRKGRAKWQHAREIRAGFGYREFTDGGARFRLARWLYALCWTGTDRPSVLFDRATAWLVTEKVLLPGASALERLIARIRARAAQRLWRTLARNITPAQRDRLDALLISDDGRPSALDRLRDGPYLRSGAELYRAVERLDEVRLLTAGLPETLHVPPGRVAALARFATVAKAQAVARMPEERRMATLLAFVRILEATAQDDVLDLLDIVVTKLFSDAAAVGKKTRLRTIRDLDAAALKLRHAGAVLMDDTVDDAAVRAAAFAKVTRADLAHALEQIDLLIRPPGDLYFAELRAQNSKLRFMPALLRAVAFGAAPAGQPVLDAVHHLRANEKRGPSGAAPLAFVPSGWKRQVRAPDGAIDKVAYRLCLLEGMRSAIRRRDLFASPSLRYADPRLGLLSGPAWEAARPAICRTLGLSTDAPAEIARLSERLDLAYRTTAANLPGNADVAIDDGELVLTALERVDDPPSLVALKAAVAARLPRVDLPELLLEMHARTGFADGFTHASEGGARVGDVATSICAVLLAEACNTGFEPLIRLDKPSLRRSRLSWVRQNYIRAETLTRANAALVAAQNHVLLARVWGGGDVASADGLRFVVPIRTIHSGPNPHYFGQERGVTFYNLVSDQFTGLNGITVPGTLRDSLVLLSVVLEAADRAAADRNHDRHRRLHRHHVRHLSPARLPVQPASGRHRRLALLARGRASRLRPAQCARGAARQHRADCRALGRPASLGRLAQARDGVCIGDDPHAADQGPADQARSRARRVRAVGENALPAPLHRRPGVPPPHSGAAQPRRGPPPTRPDRVPRQARRAAAALSRRPRGSARRARARGQRHRAVEHSLHGRGAQSAPHRRLRCARRRHQSPLAARVRPHQHARPICLHVARHGRPRRAATPARPHARR